MRPLESSGAHPFFDFLDLLTSHDMTELTCTELNLLDLT